MNQETFYVLSFASTHVAMAAEAAFKQAHTQALLIPTPRGISAGCGMSLKFTAEDNAQARAAARAVPDVVGQAELHVCEGAEFRCLEQL